MNPVVSVVCFAYNHKKYIRKSLDSILCQKTQYPYEVIVNDDCSTDGTTEILKEYEIKNKNLRVIYHNENQYSQGVKIIPRLIEETKGEIVFFCECDDYYCDEYKIEKQVNMLKNHSECVASIHSAIRVSENGNDILGYRKPLITNQVLSLPDIIRCVGGHLYALNSLACYRRNIINLDDLYYDCVVGDIPIALHLALQGNFVYSNNNMSAYRVNSIGSWNQRIRHDYKKNVEFCSSVICLFNKVKHRVGSNDKILKIIDLRIDEFVFNRAVASGNITVYKNTKYRNMRKMLPLKTRLGVYLRALRKN